MGVCRWRECVLCVVIVSVLSCRMLHAMDIVDPLPLHTAVASGNVDLVMHLLVSGANVHAVDNSGGMPLHRAVNRDREMGACRMIVALLLRKGANVNARNGAGITPLMVASLKGRCELVRMLIDHGPDFHALDIRGDSAMQWAERGNQVGVLRLLEGAERVQEARARGIRSAPMDIAVVGAVVSNIS